MIHPQPTSILLLLAEPPRDRRRADVFGGVRAGERPVLAEAVRLAWRRRRAGVAEARQASCDAGCEIVVLDRRANQTAGASR